MAHGGRLVYIYGPPAVGKLTVASALHEQTGFRLFHNHLTVNALTSVFDFATPPFTEVLHRLRLDVFATAAAAGVDVIFTNNSVWAVEDGRSKFAAFATTVCKTVEAAGGAVHFVQLTAPPGVLRARVADPSRRTHGKLLDPTRLTEVLAAHVDPRPLHADDLVVDTSAVAPSDAAGQIGARFQLGAAS